jgi:dTDP-4-dehydrorhamnose reductase
MKTISIIGISGAIGYRIFNYLSKNLTEFKVIGTYYKNPVLTGDYLDVTNKKQVENYIIRNKPAIIIWLAGTKDVQKCEEDIEYALALNTTPIITFASVLNKISHQSRFIYLSSDYVFDGNLGEYEESAKCNPLTNYGKSKYLAELVLSTIYPHHLIIRTSAVMLYNRGFLGWLLNQIHTHKEVILFSNTYFSPTPISSLIMAIEYFIRQNNCDIKLTHLSGPRISRFDFGKKLVMALKLDGISIAEGQIDLLSSTFQSDISLKTSDIAKPFVKDTWGQILKEINCANRN